MARRMISTTVATDTRLNGVSVEAELLFLKMLPWLDRDGMTNGHPLVLAGRVCPLRPTMAANIEALLAELCDAGLVQVFDTDDGPVVFFPRFSKHQKGMRYDRQGESEFPCPPGWKRTKDGLVPIGSEDADTEPSCTCGCSGCANAENGAGNGARREDGAEPDQLRTNSGVTPPKDKGKFKLRELQVNASGLVVEQVEQVEADAASQEPIEREKDEPTLADVMKLHEQVCGSLTVTIVDDMEAWAEEVPIVWMLEALDIAAEQNKRSWAYARGCLKRWREQGRTAENSPRRNGLAPEPIVEELSMADLLD